MEFGLTTFVDRTPDPRSGELISAERRMANLLEEAELAERVGLDVFGVGEHHREDFVVSAPAVTLAAIAARTQRMRLTSAVTVLSSDDPVRVFQAFAHVDLISGGRAEIMAGRGSFIESFPLFGLDLERYDELFATNLERLLRIRAGEPVNGMQVYPRPVQDPLPVWIAVGGTPQSVARAGALGLPLAIAIIGGEPERFKPLVELHRRAAAEYGHEPPPVAINSHGYVADTDEQAADEFWGPYSAVMSKIGRERGWPPMTRAQYDHARSPQGHLAVGSPETVARKLQQWRDWFGHDRYLAQFSVGTLPHERLMRSIELFGTEVAPVLRAAG